MALNLTGKEDSLLKKQSLIIDSNYICHATYHSLPPLAFRGKDTSVIFGFLKRIISFIKRFPEKEIVFVWDSVYSIRREVYPEYKKVREENSSEISEYEKRSREVAYAQFSEIREVVLPMLGFTKIYSQNGYEADDIMASLLINNPEYKFIIITTDKDIYQLISEKCMLFNPVTKSMETMTTFYDKYDCFPHLWGKARSISGCSTDNVRGVKGVAEKTAIRYLTGKLKSTNKKYKDIEAAKEMIENNKELIILPMYGTEDIKINTSDSTDRHKLIKVCEAYGFRSLINKENLDLWDKLPC